MTSGIFFARSSSSAMSSGSDSPPVSGTSTGAFILRFASSRRRRGQQATREEEGGREREGQDARNLQRARAEDARALVLGHVVRRDADGVGRLLLARAGLELREMAREGEGV